MLQVLVQRTNQRKKYTYITLYSSPPPLSFSALVAPWTVCHPVSLPSIKLVSCGYFTLNRPYSPPPLPTLHNLRDNSIGWSTTLIGRHSLWPFSANKEISSSSRPMRFVCEELEPISDRVSFSKDASVFVVAEIILQERKKFHFFFSTFFFHLNRDVIWFLFYRTKILLPFFVSLSLFSQYFSISTRFLLFFPLRLRQ